MFAKTIVSSENRIIKDIKSLKLKKYREQKGLFLVEGYRLVKEAFNCKMNVRTVVINSECPRIRKFFLDDDPGSSFEEDGPGFGLDGAHEIIQVPEKLFKEISDTDNPQGILATVEMRRYSLGDILGGENLYVILESLNDPGNAGTIIRTAHAAGFTGVIVLKGSVDIYNPKTVRATMGSLFAIPCCTDVLLNEAVKEFQQRGIMVYAGSPHSGKPCYSLDLSRNAALIIGNEAGGVSNEAIELCDSLISIPMPGGAESLNASSAAAMLIYESVRQRMKPS